MTHDAATRQDATAVTAGQDVCPCEYLEWDSTFFGFRIARVRAARLDEPLIDAVMAWCADRRIRCLYLLADAQDPTTSRLAEAAGFRFVDVRATFEWRAGDARADRQGESGGNHIRAARAEDIPALRAIARGNYRATRFRFDTGFPEDRVDALYETWAEKSCLGYADAVLVADSDDGPCGYVSCHVEGAHAGRIGLVGVRDGARGRGIGLALVGHALAWFESRDMARVRVVTQGRNITAQRLYERCGFLIDTADVWYHRWFGLE
jgi:dTDP-4-amino-4,6-dideoxy-D-galactose acyltransferase